MGGNALKDIDTQRLEAKDYYALEKRVLSQLKGHPYFQSTTIETIKAYAEKESFGDMDILMSVDSLDHEVWPIVLDIFKPRSFVRNGDVTSFDVDNFQIDIILTDDRIYDFSKSYYAYNDLGNLMGIVAHNFGVKFGHQGLFYQHRDPSTGDLIENIPLSTSFEEALTFLGFDYSRWSEGFKNKQAIFEYVSGSTHFSKDLYLLENRNYKARVRDAKRTTYREFLDWLELRPDLPSTQSTVHSAASFFPWLQREIDRIDQREEDVRSINAKYNGAVVSRLTERAGVEIRQWMLAFEKRWDSDNDFKSWVLQSSPEEIEQQITLYKNLSLAPLDPPIFSKTNIREWTGLEGKKLNEFLSRFPQQWPSKRKFNEWLENQDILSMKIEVLRQFGFLKHQLGVGSCVSSPSMVV